MGEAVAFALYVTGGGITLRQLGSKLGLDGSFWTFIDDMNRNFGGLGYLIIGIFVACWLISASIYRFKRFDEIEVSVIERR